MDSTTQVTQLLANWRDGDTAALKEFLWRERILVRDCASFGLPGYVRVGVRSEAENDRLIDCLSAFSGG